MERDETEKKKVETYEPYGCVGCGRIMSKREAQEQGVCDACATGDN